MRGEEVDVSNVAVLMSTYNGEKYLREQIESIFVQEGVSVRLVVRDDGSQDGTLAILQEYARHLPITIVQDGERLGPGESFLRLLYAHAHDDGVDYFAFADQDDVWLVDKLATGVAAIRDQHTSEPILYSSNQLIYADGEVRGVRHSVAQSVELVPHITRNTIAGCTFVLNTELACLVADAGRPDPRVIEYRLHDAWLMLVAIVCGHAIYDEDPHMLYRIHTDNTVGIRGVTLTQKMRRLRGLLARKGSANLRSESVQELLRLYPNTKAEYRDILELYANYKHSLSARLRLALNKTVRRECAEGANVFSIKVLMGFV